MPYYVKPTSDIFFKYLFGSEENKDLLLSFVNAVLDDSGFTRIVEVELKNPFNLKTFLAEKESILDIKAIDEKGRLYDIEMQASSDDYYIHRTLYYWSKLYSSQLQETEKYIALKPAICINILDFILFDQNSTIHSCYLLRELNNPDQILTDHIMLHYIELPKIEDTKVKEKLRHWINFLKNAGKEDDVMQFLLREDMEINKAHKVYGKFTRDEHLRELYEAREKWKKDYNTGMYVAEQRGIKKGIEQGVKKGELQNKQKILVKLLTRKFGLSDEEEKLIYSSNNLDQLDSALDEILFAEAKDTVLAYLK